jgi:drug/metabolite transporter (DMT)-like permease
LSKRLILFTGLIDTAAWVFYALAVVKEEVAVITAIVAGYPVIAMILAVKFNKEKITSWQYFGAFLALLGSILMSFLI